MTPSQDKLINASVIAQCAVPDILFCCMSLARESDMPEWKARHRLSEARLATERMLVAILAAEQALAPRAVPVAANDISADTTYDAAIAAVDQVMREGMPL